MPVDALLSEFPPVSTAEWEEQIRKDLRGADYAKLIWQTEEGFAVKPFYRAEDLREVAAPARPSGGWRIRETVADADAARKALAGGSDEIGFQVGPDTDLEALLAAVEGAPAHFQGCELERIAELAERHPGLRGSADAAGPRHLVARIRQAAPEFRPLTVRAFRFHEAGATSAQELAFGLAEAAQMMSTCGAENAPVLAFAVGSNYFFEIAKFRAARKLWPRVAAPLGATGDPIIYARTSLWNKTVYSTHVNILRATTEAMSAAIGGADSIEVGPFDEPYREPRDASRRLARNTLLILRKEAHLGAVADAAAGSYYVEALTDALAREAWKLMKEAAPGVEMSLDAARTSACATNRVFVGTNKYPDPQERMLEQIERPAPLPRRGAEQFERIRLRTERNRTPLFVLLEVGDPKLRAAHATFAASFFACAGFVTREVIAGEDHDAAARAILEHNPDAVVLCGSGPFHAELSGLPVIEAASLTGSDAVTALTAWQDRLGMSQ